jgi:hypothetical protein
MIIDGLPPGTTIEIEPIHKDFICHNSPCGQNGGYMGGQFELFDSTLELRLTGTGELAGFNRVISLPVTCETHTGGRDFTAPARHFDTLMWSLQGNIVGDPDFASLTVTAGDANLPESSLGMTTLTDLGDGTYHIDSFFDIAYEIDFTGAPGSILDGFSGATEGRVVMFASGATIFTDGFESSDVSSWSRSVE